MAFPRNLELEAQLVADPDNDAAYVVYGDWLQHHGSPHGELINVQHALLAAPRNVALRRREAELLEHHGAELVGESVVERIHLLGWHAGFVRSAQLTIAQLLDLSNRPAGVLLGDLDVHDGPTLQPAIDRLMVAALPVVTLRLGASGNTPAPSREVGDLGRLWRALPRLGELVVEDGAVELGDIASPSLRKLVLRPTTLTPDHIASLAVASLPGLEYLELWFEHDQPYSYLHESGNRWGWSLPRSQIRLEDLRPLFAESAFPELRHLRVANTTLGDELCRLIVSSPLPHQLHSLGLTQGTITDAGAAVLARHRPAFHRLERIDLEGNRIATEAVLDGLPRAGTRWIQYPLRDP